MPASSANRESEHMADAGSDESPAVAEATAREGATPRLVPMTWNLSTDLIEDIKRATKEEGLETVVEWVRLVLRRETRRVLDDAATPAETR